MRRLRSRRREEASGAAPERAGAETEREIVASLRRLRTTTAREVMTPRVDVVALQAPVAAEDVTRAVKESGHSRFPVYGEDLDHLTGVLFVKDLFRMNEPPSAETITRRLRKPFLVPETRLVLELLQEMRNRRIAFGVVVDEYGGVDGVLTVKDLVSELVGDLPDEFDRSEDAPINRVDASRWLVEGHAPVERLRSELDLDIPAGEYVTLGGFLFDRFGRIPAEGDVILHDGWEFRVTGMDRRRIAQVVVRAPEGRHAGGAETSVG